MTKNQPTITTADGKRQFACSAAAVVVFIVNQEEKLLLLSHPKRGETWEVVSGALEAEETALEGVLRETYEEAGADLQVRPLGAVHISTFHYDENVRYMLSLNYLLAYEGGQVRPGDDMQGSRFGWWSLAELNDERVKVIIPRDKWLLRRAIDLYRLWKEEAVDLQPDYDPFS